MKTAPGAPPLFRIPKAPPMKGAIQAHTWNDLQPGLWVQMGLGNTWHPFRIVHADTERAILEAVALQPDPTKEWNLTKLAGVDYTIIDAMPLRIVDLKPRQMLVSRLHAWARIE